MFDHPMDQNVGLPFRELACHGIDLFVDAFRFLPAAFHFEAGSGPIDAPVLTLFVDAFCFLAVAFHFDTGSGPMHSLVPT